MRLVVNGSMVREVWRFLAAGINRNVRYRRTFFADHVRRYEMKKIPFIFGLGLACLLLNAGIAANIGGQMPEMRGASIAQALR